MAILEEVAAGGISFELSGEQRALRELAREFAEKEIRPKAAEYDEHATHPADVIVKAHDVGLMNVHLPEEYGGPGLPGFAGMLIGEELSWGCAGICVSIVANTLGACARGASPEPTSRSANGCRRSRTRRSSAPSG